MSEVPATENETQKEEKKGSAFLRQVSIKNIYGHTPTMLNRKISSSMSPTASIRQMGGESLTTLRLQMMATMEKNSKTHSSKGRAFLNQRAHIGSGGDPGGKKTNVEQRVFTNEEKLSLKRMRKIVRKVNRFTNRKKWSSIFLVALWIVAALASFSEQQMLWDNENKASDDTDSLKCFVALLSILMALGVWWRRHLLLNEQKVLGAVPKDVFLWNSHMTLPLILEMLFNLFCAPPFYNYEFEYRLGGKESEIYAFYTLDVLASVFIVARIYHTVPLLGHWLRIEDAHSKVYARLNSVALDDHFTAKVLMKTNPLMASSFMAVVVCTILSYCCWIFERGYCAPWANQYDMDNEINERCSTNHVDRSDEIGDAFW
jgi:hypothetical protein